MFILSNTLTIKPGADIFLKNRGKGSLASHLRCLGLREYQGRIVPDAPGVCLHGLAELYPAFLSGAVIVGEVVAGQLELAAITWDFPTKLSQPIGGDTTLPTTISSQPVGAE